ncbi:hypothetical protein IFM89_023828 [Coptis chinensis]|uniref:Ankyrin repeat domain-containing protein n=1 Tax=Coptis chinensis TaxID=261450 RepID=A0A835J078_9MAGN|nr:hypothetical protein IFM89_023828 [Coptis chinensis]
MQSVVVSIKSRRVAMTSDEFFSSCNENETESDYGDPFEEDEKSQLEVALKIDSSILAEKGDELRRGRDTRKPSLSSESSHRRKESHCESEYKKGLRPILWLSPNFPLQTEELLPLLDFLANKVKAIRCLRELLTTNLPPGTFPVKVVIPVVPTIRVLVTFTKFEELQPLDEFSTPPLSPRAAGNESPAVMQATDEIKDALLINIRRLPCGKVKASLEMRISVKMKLVAPHDVPKRNISKWKCYERMGRIFG